MKKNLLLSFVALALAGCHTVDQTPDTGLVGNYGFTYDLDGTTSPFVDTSYRPLTTYDLAAPIIVVVTNRPPPTLIPQPIPQPGDAQLSGQSSSGTALENVARPGTSGTGAQINEAAGSEQNPPDSNAFGTAPTAVGVPTSGRVYQNDPDTAVSTSVNITNANADSVSGTNQLNVSGTITNQNRTVAATNNFPSPATNRPNYAATNNVIYDAAGSEITNQFPQPSTNAPVPPAPPTPPGTPGVPPVPPQNPQVTPPTPTPENPQSPGPGANEARP